jgi:hypothetical protein
MGINRMSDVYLRKITNNPKNPDHIAQKTRSYSPKNPVHIAQNNPFIWHKILFYSKRSLLPSLNQTSNLLNQHLIP